jgi:agmatine deiminase
MAWTNPAGSAPAERRLLGSQTAFARAWNRQFFIGPSVLTGDRSAPDGNRQIRLPGDFESHEAIVVVADGLARDFPEIFTTIVASSKGRQSVIALVSSPAHRKYVVRVLAKDDLSPDSVRFVLMPTNTIWMRDFGPLFVCGPDRDRHAVDPGYGKPSRTADDAVPAAVARQFQATLSTTELTWHGGNLLSNGRGLVLTTIQAVNANIEAGHDTGTIKRFLGGQLGAVQIVALEPLRGENTSHVDMFACFTSADTVVVGDYSQSVDRVNAAVLDRNAERLAGVRVGNGKLKVVRIPMPSNRDGVWRTYTNVVFVGGTLLVPGYPRVSMVSQRRAMAVYERCLPDWKVVSVDLRALIRHEGGLRCISTYVPSCGEDRKLEP